MEVQADARLIETRLAPFGNEKPQTQDLPLRWCWVRVWERAVRRIVNNRGATATAKIKRSTAVTRTTQNTRHALLL